MGKNPAFQFYPSDWQRDLDDHPLEIEGAWIRICGRLFWTEGVATKTLEEWSRILRKNQKKTQEILNYLSDKHIADLVNQNGSITITCRRMVRDASIRKIRKQAGEKGGNPVLLGNKNEGVCLTKTEAKREQNDEQKPTPSSSSSSSKKKDIVGGAKKRTPTNPEIPLFISYAHETFEKRFHEKIHIDGGKDGAIVKKLLSTYGIEKLKKLWDAFLEADDPFIKQAGYSIGIFKTQVNKLVSMMSNEPTKPAFGLTPETEAKLKEMEKNG